MTVIRPNSISGVTSITAQGGDINVFRADGTAGDLTINNIVGAAATFTGVLTYEDVANVDSVGVITARGGINVVGNDLNVGSNIKIGNASGIVTATTFVGALTGTASGNATISSNADNRIITGGSGNALTGESTLTYSGDTLLSTNSNFVIKSIDTNASNSENYIQFNAGYITYDSDASDSTGYSGHYFQADGAEKLRINGSGQLIFDADTNTWINRPAADTLAVTTGGSERVRIDSSGRLLVGTNTSRNVGDLTAKIQLEGSGYNQSSLSLMSNAGASAGNTAHFTMGKSRGSSTGSNTIVADGDILGQFQFAGADGTDCNTVACSIFGRVDGTPGSNDMPGALTFNTTSDGAASPTERFRIDSTGRMTQNGTTSADTASALTLKNGFPSSDHTILELISDPNQYSLIYFGASDDRYKGQIRYKDNDHFMDFRTNGTDRLRIDASGALTVSSTTDGCLNLNTTDSRGSFIRFQQGGSSQAFVGCGNGLGLGNTNTLALRSDADIRIRTGAEEHVHIGTSGLAAFKGAAGNWIHSNHPSNYHFHQFSSSRNGDWMMQFRQEHHNGLGFNMRVNNNNNNEAIALYRENQSNYGFKVYNTGNVGNINNSYGSLSDVSLKENIVDAKSQWNDIKEIKVRNFNLKSDDDKVKMLGVVAQELETVSPKLVFEDKDGVKGVHYSVLYMKAIKCLQEAQARIETLESKVAALEGS